MATATTHLARKEHRHQVRIVGMLKYMSSCFECRVVNLSADGIGLALSDATVLTLGVPVTFSSSELGHLTGVVAWVGRSGVVGLKLKHTTSTYAQVSSYFRFFHQDYVPVLKA